MTVRNLDRACGSSLAKLLEEVHSGSDRLLSGRTLPVGEADGLTGVRARPVTTEVRNGETVQGFQAERLV
jgi:hypothetical protein